MSTVSVVNRVRCSSGSKASRHLSFRIAEVARTRVRREENQLENIKGLIVISGAGEELGVTPGLLSSVSTGKHFVGEIGCRNDVFAGSRGNCFHGPRSR